MDKSKPTIEGSIRSAEEMAAQTLKDMESVNLLSENDPFHNDWTIINNSMDLMEVHLNEQHDMLRMLKLVLLV